MEDLLASFLAAATGVQSTADAKPALDDTARRGSYAVVVTMPDQSIYLSFGGTSGAPHDDCTEAAAADRTTWARAMGARVAVLEIDAAKMAHRLNPHTI